MTLRPIITFLFLIIISSSIRSQEDFGVLFWLEDRDLEWSDFKGSPLVDSSGGFFLDLYIESVAVNGTSVIMQSMYEPKTYIFTKTSYASEELRTDDLLRYFNVYFDLAAYYSHEMVERLIRARNSDDEMISKNSHVIKNAVIEEWRSESARMAIETQYGIEIEQLIMWEKDIEDRLATIEEPVFAKSKYSMTLDLTFGPLVGISEYKDYLTQPTAGVLGVEFSKAPFTYNIGLSGGGQKVKHTFRIKNEVFPISTEPNIMNIFLHIGYELLDNRKWRIVPRLGAHFSNLRYPVKDDLDANVWARSISAGTTVDYKLNSWNKKGNVHMLFSEVGLRFGAYLYPMSMSNLDLSHVLLTAGLSWTFGPINAHYPE